MSTGAIYRSTTSGETQVAAPDRLVSLAGEGNPRPRVEAELRFFVAKHPMESSRPPQDDYRAVPEDREGHR